MRSVRQRRPATGIKYLVVNGDREFELQVISHLDEADSTSGKDVHTPDEIITHRDFIIGKLNGNNGHPLT